MASERPVPVEHESQEHTSSIDQRHCSLDLETDRSEPKIADIQEPVGQHANDTVPDQLSKRTGARQAERSQ